MASSRTIEEETGTYRGHRIHRHNGYYAGDFASGPLPLFSPTRPAASSRRPDRPARPATTQAGPR